ncbi:MAG: 50S ribosomal protein L32 [Deltaproteobacteria bacterium]|nr:50S ribosomal protein L32 [Deltaproteobacteria bacterium]
MAPRRRGDDDGLNENPFEEYCPSCGQYLAGESICLNCGAQAYNESGVEEIDEEDMDVDAGDFEDEI